MEFSKPVTLVKEILEEPIAGCPGAYGKYIIEDLLGQFMAYNIGGWFLEKVASDNKKLLEIKDKKIRATSALNAESLSSSQFEKRQKCSIPSVIEDNSSAIENFAFSKNQAEDNFKTPNEY